MGSISGDAAVAIADRGDDESLRIMARLFLAAMLSISVRGWDEGAAATIEALHLAERAGRSFEEATARGVIAGIDLIRADYGAAAGHALVGVAQCRRRGRAGAQPHIPRSGRRRHRRR